MHSRSLSIWHMPRPAVTYASSMLCRKRARAIARLQYFDAATAANDAHAAAWHGWGLLEKQQGDVVRARDIWMKVTP